MTLNCLSLRKISKQVEHAINADLKKVDKWYKFNQMKRNHSKYQAITLGRVERNPVLTCKGTVIPIQDEMELLSLTLDNKLKFEGQIRKICRKVSQQVAVLDSAFIAPHFNYCSES